MGVAVCCWDPGGGGGVCRLAPGGRLQVSGEDSARIFKMSCLQELLGQADSARCTVGLGPGGHMRGFQRLPSRNKGVPAQREAARTRAHGINQRCCFIYTTRATSCLMRYKTLDSGESGMESAVEKDTVVGKTPPTHNKTRMRKPRTKSPTPLSKRKNRWKVQTIRENGLRYRRNKRLAARRTPCGARTGALGTRRGGRSARSSWVNRVCPLLYVR